MRFFLLGLLSYSLVLLSGCTAQYTSFNSTNTSYPPAKNEGYVAFSTECVGPYPMAILNYKNVNSTFASSLKIDCSSSSADYFLRKLPSGRYEFSGFTATDMTLERGVKTSSNGSFDNIFGISKKNIYFNVAPGKVNYIGKLKFIVSKTDEWNAKNHNMITNVYNNSADDILVIRSMYPSIPSRLYKIEIARAQG